MRVGSTAERAVLGRQRPGRLKFALVRTGGFELGTASCAWREHDMLIDLGALTREDPRAVWANEARDLTPWVGAHLEKLGEVLGMDLELVRTESDVGDFAIDVLARDLTTQRLVVIENQLEQTDHTHLGQVITYAAGVDAGVVVWLTPAFREEHRQAVDWLNRGLGNSTQFFAVAIEVLRIDGSKPAVNFRVVAQPAGYGLGAGGATKQASQDTDTSDRGKRYQAFFQRLLDELREKYHFTNARAGQSQSWYSFSSGVRGFQYGANFPSGGRIAVELYIDFGDDEVNLSALRALQQQREAIERELGEKLDWQELETRRACRIVLYGAGSILDPQDKLDEYHDWMVKRLLSFKRAFGPRLKLASERVAS
jgi:hypothetical protein